MPDDIQLANPVLLRKYLCMFRLRLSALALMFFLSAAFQGQTPVKVSVCDLVREPEKYSRQFIQVRGTVDIAFEDFSLRTHDCGEQLRSIWLAYGGDEPTPTTSTANDRTRKLGTILQVGGIAVPLQRDAALELFKGRLLARRMRPPDGPEFCDADCRLYNVTATLTGLFMAAPNRPNDSLSGYGHLGCCHLLTIQQVSDVDAIRTEVPAGGRFACSTETWEMAQIQANEALNQRPCSTLLDCRKTLERQFGMLAQHWGDEVDVGKGTALGLMTAAPMWRSADFLTTYALHGHYSDGQHRKGTLLNATASRTVCKPTEAPYPPSTPISCKMLFSDFRGDKKDGAASKDWDGKPDAVSSYALEEAARRWSVDLLPGLTLDQCSKPMVTNGDQFTWCNWNEPTSMQSFDIQISRSRVLHQLRGWDSVPWMLTRGEGVACTAEAR
jgi:hypothetical protein